MDHSMKKIFAFLFFLLLPVAAGAQTVVTLSRVDTIAALKAMTTSRPQVVLVNDANPGIFNLSSGACAAADDIYQVQPTGGTTVCYTRMASEYSVGDSPSFTGTITLQSIVETVSAVSITDNVLTINLSSGATVYTTSSNANITTFTISNVPAGATAFTLVMTGNGTTYTQTWGATVMWPNGVPPSLTTTMGQRDVITFITTNGGTDWLASITQNF
jgi:hypothetical protein